MNAYLQSKYILSFETLIYRTKLAFGNLWPELKGQIISKRFFSGRGFFKKTNENTSHTSKYESISSFFLKNPRLDNLLSKLTDL